MINIPHLDGLQPAVTLMLDTEFNGRNGDLLSLALVSVEGHEWYGVLEHDPATLVEWVQENVVPRFNQAALPRAAFLTSLERFLQQFVQIRFIYNARADERYLTGVLKQLHDIPLYTLYRDGFINSQASRIPHNALEDARALIEQVYGSEAPVFDGVSVRDVVMQLKAKGMPFDARQLEFAHDASYTSPNDDDVCVRVTFNRQNLAQTAVGGALYVRVPRQPKV